MFEIKNIFYILCCFLFLVTDYSFGSEKDGIKKAKVNVPESIIYSDPKLKSPIGKIHYNAIISIGNPLEINPQVVPVIVAGKVAYIKIIDLTINDELNPIFHDPDLLIQKPPENILKNNTAYLGFHQLSTGTDVSQMFQNIDSINIPFMPGISLSFLHRQCTTRLIWGMGFEYYSRSSQNANFSFLLFNPTVGFSPLKNSLFSLDLLFSFDFTFGNNFIIQNNYYSERSGFLYGPNIGARLVLLSFWQYHLTGTVSYRAYSMSGTTNYYDAQDVSYPAMKTLRGINISLGIAIDL